MLKRDISLLDHRLLFAQLIILFFKLRFSFDTLAYNDCFVQSIGFILTHFTNDSNSLHLTSQKNSEISWCPFIKTFALLGIEAWPWRKTVALRTSSSPCKKTPVPSGSTARSLSCDTKNALPQPSPLRRPSSLGLRNCFRNLQMAVIGFIERWMDRPGSVLDSRVRLSVYWKGQSRTSSNKPGTRENLHEKLEMG